MAGNFLDEEKVKRDIGRNPGKIVGILEDKLSQTQIDALEPLISPAPVATKEIDLLEKARLIFIERNMDVTNSVIVAIDARIAVLTP